MVYLTKYILPPEGTVAPLPTISPVDKQNKKTEPSLGRHPTDANKGVLKNPAPDTGLFWE